MADAYASYGLPPSLQPYANEQAGKQYQRTTTPTDLIRQSPWGQQVGALLSLYNSLQNPPAWVTPDQLAEARSSLEQRVAGLDPQQRGLYLQAIDPFGGAGRDYLTRHGIDPTSVPATRENISSVQAAVDQEQGARQSNVGTFTAWMAQHPDLQGTALGKSLAYLTSEGVMPTFLGLSDAQKQQATAYYTQMFGGAPGSASAAGVPNDNAKAHVGAAADAYATTNDAVTGAPNPGAPAPAQTPPATQSGTPTSARAYQSSVAQSVQNAQGQSPAYNPNMTNAQWGDFYQRRGNPFSNF